ncbi:uncharacterized protein LOC129570388 [Sitodiplosis mosellana]|uniref:uncharacterized protein LOC129570388 n=1 Tax=Sitodiplosis mosellana TaxID=263140 RepID=UPI002444E5AF|nr:uncharacterized protein LOC129570388 [Sitodiplosis mosellana]
MPATRSSRITTYTEQNRLNRQRSGSQTTLDSNDRRQTYGGMRRSTSSVNLRTPRRTPRHNSRSPGNRTPSSVTSLTSNTEQHRRMAGENTAKVMELIQSFRSFFKNLNLGNGGLRTMTLNQFIDIISILMVRIGGKATISKIRNNHEEVIINLLKNVKYPYVVNKSCLKTPNAHGSYPEVIAILAYLCDLVRDIKNHQPSDVPLIPCDQLMNTDHMLLFDSEVNRNYYDLYINEPPRKLDEGFPLDKEGEIKLVNGYIAAKMKQVGLTVEELAARTDKLKVSSEELERNLVVSDCEKYFNSIEEQLAEKEREYVKIQEILVEKRKYLKMVNMTYDEKARKLAAKKAELQNLMRQIENQTYTTLDIKQLIAKETSIKNSIAMIQNETGAIQVEAVDDQVKLARLQKLKMDGIQKFNEFTFHITKILMQSRSFQQLNIIDYTIDPTASTETIQNMCLRLNRLNEICAQVKQEHIKQIEQNKVALAEYKSQHSRLMEKYSNQMAVMQKANKKLEISNQKCANYETEGSSSVAKLKRVINEKIATKQRIDDEITVLRKKIDELEIKNVQLFEDGERQAYEIIQAKQTLCRELDELNNYIDDCTYDI